MAEKEYIDREGLLFDIGQTVIFTVRSGVKLPTAEMRGANKVIDRIKSAPAADVVEVVRCKDCKYFAKYKCRADGGMEQMMCTLVNGTYDENWYCADGVAKMDGEKV